MENKHSQEPTEQARSGNVSIAGYPVQCSGRNRIFPCSGFATRPQRDVPVPLGTVR
uniref:Uncharacterized protein n=1 Tax=Anopheles atroparvus TaxID=41427 RepID=A0AAG5CWY8_ANOAO